MLIITLGGHGGGQYLITSQAYVGIDGGHTIANKYGGNPHIQELSSSKGL